MVLRVLVRRFKCLPASCPAVTFVEQIEGLTSPFARYTAVLDTWLAHIGLALAGRGPAGRFAGCDGLARHTAAAGASVA